MATELIYEANTKEVVRLVGYQTNGNVTYFSEDQLTAIQQKPKAEQESYALSLVK